MARGDRREGGESERLSGYSAPALEKGIRVIELLATAPGGMTISEMAAALGVSISQIFRMIMVMERRQWLHKEPGSDRYRVTYKVLDLAYRATPAQELAHVATPIMYALSHETEQACHLVVRNGSDGLVIARQESPGPIGFSVRTGTRVDLFTSGSGHVLLAFGEPEDADVLLSKASAEEAARLRNRFALIRRRGYEAMDSARTKGVRDVSFPVFGFDGRIVAAVTIPYVTYIDGIPRMAFDEAREKLRAAARRISEGLGYCPGAAARTE